MPQLSTKAEKSFWSPKEAAHYVGVSLFTFYSWISPDTYTHYSNVRLKSRPPAYRFGAKWKIPIVEFKQWVETFREN